jgi:hypothetical protein
MRRKVNPLAYTKNRKAWVRHVVTNVAHLLAVGIILQALFPTVKIGTVAVAVGIAATLAAGLYGYLLAEV